MLNFHVASVAVVLVLVGVHVAVPHPVAPVRGGVVNVAAMRVVVTVRVEVGVWPVLVWGRGGVRSWLRRVELCVAVALGVSGVGG